MKKSASHPPPPGHCKTRSAPSHLEKSSTDLLGQFWALQKCVHYEMFLSCRPWIWCVSDDSELFLGSFGSNERYEKHFEVVEQSVSMISGDFFLRFSEKIGGAFLKNPKSQENIEIIAFGASRR